MTPTVGSVCVGDRLPSLTKEVTPTTIVLGALASRDWRPMHHDHHFATGRNGTPDIFMNTPNLAAWLERYLTDWSGPRGRLGRMTFRMRDTVLPGQTMTIRGVVRTVEIDDAGCGWVAVDLDVSQGDRTCTVGVARLAIPTGDGDNPWARRGARWRP